MSITPPRTMPGVLELLPSEQAEWQRLTDVIRAQFESFGYMPVSTPTMELAEVLLRKTGGETERQVYLAKATGATDLDLALRFDLTVPLARYVAEHEHQLEFPFRRYQMQSVFRGERPQKGRYREFFQCDIDVIGKDELSLRFDAEIPAVINAVFEALDIGEFLIQLNSRKLLRGVLAALGIEQEDEVLRELDKLGKRARGSVSESLTGLGVSSDSANRLLDLTGAGVQSGDDADRLLDRLEELGSAVDQGRAEMTEVIRLIRLFGVPEERFGIDLSIARGLDYYTGTVYETVLTGYPDLGSICSGGRYDDLASHYTKSRLPGVGISIGLSRLFWQLREVGLIGPWRSPVDVVVGLLHEAGLEAALEMAAELRASGLATESTLEPDKLGRQLRSADKRGIDILVVGGEDELARGEVLIRNLRAQEQWAVPRLEMVATVERELARNRDDDAHQ